MARLYSLFIRFVKDYYSLFILLPIAGPSASGGLETRDTPKNDGGFQPGYTFLKAASMRNPGEINILIVDNDSATQDALQQMFDAEGWFARGVPDPREAMAELARRHWTLVIANVGLADADSALFITLKELAQAEEDPDANTRRLRTLFLVPAATARWAHRILEREHLPYTIKPFHLHDFLEKVSDLLVDARAIAQPARDVGTLAAAKERRQKRGGHDRRSGKMFASREDYMMTEEEIAEFEKQEEEDRKKRQEEEKKREML
ncbi:MAG: hypothetical protein WBE20_04810 [Candidatus Acidiferrales bacterium]